MELPNTPHRVLSIDVGIRNLSYCVLKRDGSDQGVSIEAWKNIDVLRGEKRPVGLDTQMEALLTALTDEFSCHAMGVFNSVIIENQPARMNGHMKTVAVAIYTFFTMMKAMHGDVESVRFVSPSNKLKCIKSISGAHATYRDRKKASIDITKTYIDSRFPAWRDVFDGHKKKDDLADSFLQGLHWLDSNGISR